LSPCLAPNTCEVSVQRMAASGVVMIYGKINSLKLTWRTGGEHRDCSGIVSTVELGRPGEMMRASTRPGSDEKCSGPVKAVLLRWVLKRFVGQPEHCKDLAPHPGSGRRTREPPAGRTKALIAWRPLGHAYLLATDPGLEDGLAMCQGGAGGERQDLAGTGEHVRQHSGISKPALAIASPKGVVPSSPANKHHRPVCGASLHPLNQN
jgi:hypothetical protein